MATIDRVPNPIPYAPPRPTVVREAADAARTARTVDDAASEELGWGQQLASVLPVVVLGAAALIGVGLIARRIHLDRPAVAASHAHAAVQDAKQALQLLDQQLPAALGAGGAIPPGLERAAGAAGRAGHEARVALDHAFARNGAPSPGLLDTFQFTSSGLRPRANAPLPTLTSYHIQQLGTANYGLQASPTYMLKQHGLVKDGTYWLSELQRNSTDAQHYLDSISDALRTLTTAA